VTIESATYIKQLDSANPGGADLLVTADDHIRLIKSVLKSTFPNLDSAVTATPTQLNSGVPIGCMMVWPFPISSMPPNWALCDGRVVNRSDGAGPIQTPNMLNKFVMGSSGTDPDAVLTTGGSASVSTTTGTAGAHSHTGTTSTDGAHSHGGSTVLNPGGNQAPGTGNVAQTIQSDGAHNHSVSTSSAGDHSHTVSVATLPPYIKLYWIMKV
jgi:hypothetical protein